MIHSFLENVKWNKKPTKSKGPEGRVFLLGLRDEGRVKSLISSMALDWQKQGLLRQTQKDTIHFLGNEGPVWILQAKEFPKAVSHGGLLEESAYATFRDQAGFIFAAWKGAGEISHFHIEILGTTEEQEIGFFVGLELAGYQFKQIRNAKKNSDWPEVYVTKSSEEVQKSVLNECKARGQAINLARHLVNLPPNDLNPKSYPALLRKINWPSAMKMDVWSGPRLVKEKMGLLMAVGQGASNKPCLIHLKWRPTRSNKKKPIAFVGKGITFDTGGLDIKPSSAMRLMKKDMGGSAAVVGLAYWAAMVNYPGPLDFYLALAENAVDGESFRPSDLITARNGAVVEIDNTDAEGRLVLADALDVAVTRKGSDEPSLIIDVATLTGAIKVALGAEVAGLFTNDDGLGEELQRAGQVAGDLNWRMPLVEKYWGNLASPFADFKNSADGFGGAITAALFLSRFVKGKSWAHLDIYAWADRANGALLSAGGSGQGVQVLIEFLKSRK